ncbi:hypothetical protein LY76DRAFT_617243 [Colletotrichum caudatum]|nr:hypothetical protein LY76DRAFT_617243 [Colletotrichum caudatum]
MQIITPLRDRPGERLSVGPSRGLFYAISQHIVVKVPFQYPALEDTDTHHLLDLALRSSVSLERELAVYQTIKAHPHLNVTRRLETDQPNCLFLQRLTPLELAWRSSSELDRRRWVLKVLDTKNDLIRDRFDLANYLHFIISGIDPFNGANSYAEVKQVRATLASGHGVVERGAEVLSGIIQDGWTGRDSSTGTPTEQPGSHYQRPESYCRGWLHNSPPNQLWKDVEEYLLDCKAVGHEADMDMWS